MQTDVVFFSFFPDVNDKWSVFVSVILYRTFNWGWSLSLFFGG